MSGTEKRAGLKDTVGISKKSKNRKRVLIVEDNPDFAALVESILEKEGFSATVSFDGEEAFKQVKYLCPDLVTLDIHLPRKSGLIFYRYMKSVDALRKIPVLIISGLVSGDPEMESMMESFLEVGNVPYPEAYIGKPFCKEILINAVKKCL